MSAAQNPPPLAADPFAPGNIIDRRNDFAGSITRHPLDHVWRTAFVHNKMHVARTHPIGDSPARNRMLFDFAKTLGGVPASHIHQPVPGGVGYGTFYTQPFRTAFITGTEILWSALCPPVPGGNVNTYLYETATNRAAAGVEALVCYAAAANPSFQIYDWARDAADRWQVNMPFAELGAYLCAQAQAGQSFPILPIWNSTLRLYDGQWRNSVYLFDAAAQSWALVYRFDYAMDEGAQRAGWVGSWAPIVETFQPLYSNTNPLGALGTRLRAADVYGEWSGWADLDATMSTLRTDQVGFQQKFLDPNYDWVVTS